MKVHYPPGDSNRRIAADLMLQVNKGTLPTDLIVPPGFELHLPALQDCPHCKKQLQCTNFVTYCPCTKFRVNCTDYRSIQHSYITRWFVTLIENVE